MAVSRDPAIDPALHARLTRLREWARLLDTAFRVPGTSIRFGWDPILGLIPGVGDLVGPAYSVFILLTAIKLRVPRIVLLRMLLTVMVDVAVGAIPVIGDLFDVVWKASKWNLALLERHAHQPAPPTKGDWWFVIAVLACLGLAAALPLIALVAFLRWIGFSLI
jgi:hypothetical protein